MLKLGYALSSEEFGPRELVSFARNAEAAGFEFALISDHYHPWTKAQTNSPFVWNVIGAISQAVKNLSLGTGVTCPLMRYRPALIAQAAATSAVMMPDRFFLGLGTGENLNEHITGDRWPTAPERLEMLEEAVEVMRLLWKGGWQSHRGKYYTVEQARIFTMPDEPPPIMIAASKRNAAELAGRIADGLISTVPERDLVKAFQRSSGDDKPRYGQLTVCYASTEDEAARTVRKHWANAGIGGPLMTDLPTPTHFDKVIETMQPDKIIEDVVLGPDPKKHIDGIRKFIDAGYDHIYVHQTGPKQEEFIRFYADKVLPKFRGSEKSTNGSNGSKRTSRRVITQRHAGRASHA
jgi:coenzyme F420-dependent glucose-6-phosphate dehydrogenase